MARAVGNIARTLTRTIICAPTVSPGSGSFRRITVVPVTRSRRSGDGKIDRYRAVMRAGIGLEDD